MELWTALLLGLAGSLHCAGMCGPLALALPGSNSNTAFLLGRLAYNAGRLLTYCALGVVFGLIGKSLALAGVQRWVSLSAGISILVALAISTRFSLSARVAKPIGWLKSSFGTLLQQRSVGSTFFLGSLNGLLPCGLVYAACVGAVASGGFISSVQYMLGFGLGTVPMMLAIGLLGKKFQFVMRFKLQRLIPVCLMVLAVLLILRALSLGIPYLSPDLAANACCHR